MTPLLEQAHTAQNALTRAVDPEPRTEKVRFYLTVTKAWLRQLVLALAQRDARHAPSLRGGVVAARTRSWPVSQGTPVVAEHRAHRKRRHADSPAAPTAQTTCIGESAATPSYSVVLCSVRSLALCRVAVADVMVIKQKKPRLLTRRSHHASVSSRLAGPEPGMVGCAKGAS